LTDLSPQIQVETTVDQGEEHACSNCREKGCSNEAEADGREDPPEPHEGGEEEKGGDGAGDAAATVVG